MSFQHNHNSFFQLIIVFAIVAIASSCKNKTSVPYSPSTGTTVINHNASKYVYLDSIASSKAILSDNLEGYFDGIQSLEMSILLKDPSLSNKDRSISLEKYSEGLARDVRSFSEKDKEFMNRVIHKLDSLLIPLKPNLVIPDIKLVKIEGDHYGPGVFYTREDCIMIPRNELDEQDMSSMMQVMLHEIFHLISRYKTETKEELYRFIGFNALNKRVQFPDQLTRRLLHNPDGLNMNYYVNLTNEEEDPIKALTVIYANSKNYDADKKDYFAYLQFDLFRLVERDDHFEVIATEDSQPEIPDLYYQSFFDQIKDNTQYIIHPDEIMADNFMMAVLDKNSPGEVDVSPEGRELLDKVKNVIFQ